MNERTGTPLLATIVSGVLSATMSLFVGLAVLVELMSIGKLNSDVSFLKCLSILIHVFTIMYVVITARNTGYPENTTWFSLGVFTWLYVTCVYASWTDSTVSQ